MGHAVSAHTPGPWTWSGGYDHRSFEVYQLAHLIDASAFSRHICTINNIPLSHRQHRDPAVAEATARLIAAAPELLSEAETLRAAVAHAIIMLDAGKVDVARDVLAQTMRQTGEAILRAEGRS